MAWLDRGGLIDQAILSTRALRGAPDLRIEGMAASERLDRLAALREVYGDPALLDVPGGLLALAPPIEPVAVRRRRYTDLRWPSGVSPFNPEVAEAWLGIDPANATATARLYGGSSPGPVIVALHGYAAGRPGLEGLVWPLRAWRRAGLDVVLPTLPLHGPRASSTLRAPRFPAADPRISHEGFRQAIHDLTGLIGWLRQRGHPRITVVGMSLGGYVAALLATVSDDVDALGLVIPLASVPLVARQHGRLGSGPDAERVQQALEAVYRPSSPLARPSRVREVRVLAARGDRITGLAHAELLAAHFDADVRCCAGSHIVQAGLAWPEITALAV